MALIQAPSSQEVYNEAGHTLLSGIGPRHFGMALDEEVLSLIEEEILPPVVRRINAKADASAFPFDFPLSTSTWQSARPGFTSGQVAEEVANQDAAFGDAMRRHAASDLLGRIQTTNDFWVKRADRLRAQGEECLKAAIEAVKTTVARTQAGQSEGASGFGLVSIQVEPAGVCDEYGGFC